MGKLANIWAFIGRHKYWVTIGAEQNLEKVAICRGERFTLG